MVAPLQFLTEADIPYVLAFVLVFHGYKRLGTLEDVKL